ncbi:EFR1 family ferrodoxin [Paramuribaculum intestinale]|uniref:EFR1 family ferrodoxin n=1 Tax=Paramuribaculum intestinale TaxID=2094151 RepID=UPI0025A976CA|nr:EFR1 family ferrodoxin [Paramuribaculum intestinale]
MAKFASMIACFSGCGNSRLVADRLAQSLNDSVTAIRHDTDWNAADGDTTRMVWVFPVYSWGIPPVVASHIASATLPETLDHYMVCTCGDDAGLTDRQWRRMIRRRGWTAVGTWSVIMPNTYVTLPGFDVDSPALASRKLEAAAARITDIARGIRHHARVDDVVRGTLPWLKSRIIYPLFRRLMMSPRPFNTSPDCTSCGLCARKCPMGNITMTPGHGPEWGTDCALCLGCYHRCPVHAVNYGRATASKGQYHSPESLP